ncbi:transmembrane protein 244 [Spea bombifrons]|uniref:transmembrane protein 244 n=1 Tax=Spea bombifrons TaxID=233779 RepID=UPI00234B6477|nr:transmembrane protein 244 [Spea bombifrons]
MAVMVKVSETKIVFQNLFICTAVFYTIYYLSHVICFIGVRVISRCHPLLHCMTSFENFDEFGPFDFKTNPSWSDKKYLVNLISLESTYIICGHLFVLIVEEWVWDYACTITVIHVIITTMVMMEFPFAIHWWITIGIGMVTMVFEGQILAYLFFRDNYIYPVLDDF